MERNFVSQSTSLQSDVKVSLRNIDLILIKDFFIDISQCLSISIFIDLSHFLCEKNEKFGSDEQTKKPTQEIGGFHRELTCHHLEGDL